MAEHLAEDLVTADLVSLTGLSRAQFFRAFRQSTSQSPHRYLNALRVEHAKQLLLRDDANPASFASVAGFATLRHFAVVFGREAGVTPKLYRRSR